MTRTSSPAADSPRRNASEANVNQSPHLSGRVGKPTGCSQAEPEEVSALRASPPRAEWTPGPWLIHARNRLIVQADGAFAELTVKDGKVVGDDLPATICLLRDPSDTFSEDETLANGFLIAAAPELYEAVRLFVEEYDASDDCDGIGMMLAYNRALEAAKSALRKARGDA